MTRSISDNVLQMTLAQANKEHNQHYPPHIFEAHYKLTSDWLKDECVKLYPTSQIIIDIIRNYLEIELAAVKNGIVIIPKLYRNFLGAGFYANDDKNCTPVALPEKAFKNPKSPTIAEIEVITAEMHVESKKIEIRGIGEWNYLSSHPYKKPKTFDKAAGCMFTGTTLKVLPLNIPYVEMRFLKKTDEFKYGYTMLPDETYVFDPATTVEELWDETAIPYLFKGVNKLCANYLRDTEYIASTTDLRENSLF